MGLQVGKKFLPAMMLVLGVAAGCGAPVPQEEENNLEWLRSRSDSTRYAYLTDADLADDFLLGVSVIGVDGFLSNALNMKTPVKKVKLALNRSQVALKLDVVSGTNTVLSFGVGRNQGRLEIDFASVGNDLKFKNLVDVVGGMFTAENENGYWLSTGQPTVTRISQDNDTVVVDLKHTVRLVLLTPQGTLDRVVSQRAGVVNLRLFLIRQKSLPTFSDSRTVAEGRGHRLGYFGGELNTAVEPNEDHSAIQRFPLPAEGKITFYLKDFPAAFVPVGVKAIESWNTAFGRKLFEVKVAGDGIDVGDPRFHVIKWFDGTDKNLGWAGVAKMIVDPDSGAVLSGSIYIQGSSVLDMYRNIVAYSRTAAQGGFRSLNGQIGNLSFVDDHGETPVVSFLSDTRKDFDDYMKNYYLETITHEVGHVLGLRHNFAGSSQPDSAGNSASIMDYVPRKQRGSFEGPGYYDVAAIRWGYFGEEPQGALPFCSDEDIWKVWNCMQDDFGDPVAYVINGLNHGASFLAQKAVAIADDNQISSIGGLVEKAMQILKLKDQLPAASRAVAEAKIPDAYRFLVNVQPMAGLSSREMLTVKANLERMKRIVASKVGELKKQNRI